MKKYLTFLLCLFLPCFIYAAPAPNGELNSFDERDNYKKYATYKMIKGIPIKYSYRLGSEGQPKGSSSDALKTRVRLKLNELDAVYFKSYIDWAMKIWPSDTAKMIREKGREKEFADILPLLSRLKLEPESDFQKADIVFNFGSQKYIDSACGSGNLGCFAKNKIDTLNPLLYYTAAKKGNKSKDHEYYQSLETLIHEVGHYYALADQYSTVNASPLYSTSDRIGGDSVMSDGKRLGLYCDDVDGFIKINGKYSARAQKGWRSFCGDGTVYRNGKVLNRKNYYAKDCEYVYNPNGSIAAKKCYFPFDLAARKLHIDTESGLIISSFDEKHNIFTEYNYVYDSQNPAVEACSYKGKDRKQTMDCIEASKENDSKWWSINNTSQDYDIKTEDKDRCSVMAVRDDAVYTWNFDDSFKFTGFSYYTNPDISNYKKISYKSLLVDKKISFMVTKQDFTGYGGYECTVFLEANKELTSSATWVFVNGKNGLVVKARPSAEEISAFAAKYKVSQQDLVKAVRERCSIKAHDNIDNKAKMCQFFKSAENNIGKGYNYIW